MSKQPIKPRVPSRTPSERPRPATNTPKSNPNKGMPRRPTIVRPKK